VPTETGSELASNNSGKTTSTSTRHPCELLGIKEPQEFIAETIAPKTAFTAAIILDVLPTTDFQADLIRTWPFTYFLVIMHGPLDKARLRAACKTLVERHEIYRTVFVSHGSDILQVILKEAEVPFFEFPCDDDEDLFSVCESACPADLDQGLSTGQLLTQFKLFYQEDPNYHILAIRLSHAQYDGFCMPLLWKDLAAIYGASELEPVTNFSAYVHHLHAQGTLKAVNFWSQTLKGSPPPARLDHLSLGATEQAQATLIELTREVPLPCPPTTITIATLMKAAAALLMMRLTNVPDLVFGQVVSGRNMALEGIETYFRCMCEHRTYSRPISTKVASNRPPSTGAGPADRCSGAQDSGIARDRKRLYSMAGGCSVGVSDSASEPRPQTRIFLV
jgi:Condensation domain.